MTVPLVVVTDAFVANGKGVLISPRVTVDKPVKGTFSLRMKLPDGSERVVTASMDVAHIQGKGGTFAMYRLLDVTPEDVPAGTELFAT
jgi:hypothetical protein